MSYPSKVEPHEVTGQLQIVGKDGKYVGEIPEHGLNNLIDGPAIDWLSRQAEPRILVSDLLFTGVNYNRTAGGEVGVTTELLAAYACVFIYLKLYKLYKLVVRLKKYERY
jgi:hypothetical protein